MTMTLIPCFVPKDFHSMRFALMITWTLRDNRNIVHHDRMCHSIQFSLCDLGGLRWADGLTVPLSCTKAQPVAKKDDTSDSDAASDADSDAVSVVVVTQKPKASTKAQPVAKKEDTSDSDADSVVTTSKKPKASTKAQPKDSVDVETTRDQLEYLCCAALLCQELWQTVHHSLWSTLVAMSSNS